MQGSVRIVVVGLGTRATDGGTAGPAESIDAPCFSSVPPEHECSGGICSCRVRVVSTIASCVARPSRPCETRLTRFHGQDGRATRNAIPVDALGTAFGAQAEQGDVVRVEPESIGQERREISGAAVDVERARACAAMKMVMVLQAG